MTTPNSKTALRNLARFEDTMASLLEAARIPGAAIAVVIGGETIYAKGFGCRDLKSRKPMTPRTLYPIASTSKAFNTTLVQLLVEEGLVDWDAPVQRYLPNFRLKDAAVSPRVKVRDLVTMRTGLPRHDWVWMGDDKITRPEFVERLAHLDASADFRERFQYNNLTSTLAGHIAEVVTGESWEELIRKRILQPLGMRHTNFKLPTSGNYSSSYHENARRKLLRSERLPAESTAPSGGSIHSNVTDMARWVALNLGDGRVNGRRLLSAKGLAELHAPQMVIGPKPLAGLPNDGSYSLGWLVDTYNGHRRVSHGGYLHDVTSSVVLFPKLGIGMVAFSNFGANVLSETINNYAFDAIMGLKPVQTFAEKLAIYEQRVKDNRERLAKVVRTPDTKPSMSLDAYAGTYRHPGYGEVKVSKRGRKLVLQRATLRVPLKHWHFDSWVAEDSGMWTISGPHAFDSSNALQFHHDVQGRIGAVSIPFEAEVAPIRFSKRQR